MTTGTPLTPSHDALLTLARKTDAAATDGDHDRLVTAARHLLDALMDHLQSERTLLSQLPPEQHRTFRYAQQDLVDLLLDLLTSVPSEPSRCPDLTRELLGVLAREADDERLTFARNVSARSTAMSVTEPLRREHAHLRPRLVELDRLAAHVDHWDDDVPTRLREVVEFLRADLIPHARAEEAALYPAVEAAMQAPGATDTMTADHVEIVRRSDELATLVASVGSEPPSREQAEQLRAQLYGLSAILQLHFAKEEEVLLPVLDAHMSSEDAAQLFARMSAATHPHEGTPD